LSLEDSNEAIYGNYELYLKRLRGIGLPSVIKDCARGRADNRTNYSYFDLNLTGKGSETYFIKYRKMTWKQLNNKQAAEIRVMKEVCPEVW